MSEPRESYLELHGGELVEHRPHGVADDVPRDLVVGLRRGFNRVPRHVVERDHVLEHAHGLVERTETIVRRVTAEQNIYHKQNKIETGNRLGYVIHDDRQAILSPTLNPNLC